MLARIDEIPGVRRSRAECSGHYVLVELSEEAIDGVAPRVLQVLGRGARVLQPDEAKAQHDARRRGEPWLTAEKARALSFIEGRMLGVRVAVTVAAELGLTAAARERLAEAVREEMFAHVERIYAGLAQAGRFFEAWPQIAASAAERCVRWVGDDRIGTLASALVDQFRDRVPRE